jgi:hypothetical protein
VVEESDSHLLEAINLMLSLDTWLRLRRGQNLSKARALAVVEAACRALVASIHG